MPGLVRAFTFLLPSSKKDVDGRDEPGHDDVGVPSLTHCKEFA